MISSLNIIEHLNLTYLKEVYSFCVLARGNPWSALPDAKKYILVCSSRERAVKGLGCVLPCSTLFFVSYSYRIQISGECMFRFYINPLTHGIGQNWPSKV